MTPKLLAGLVLALYTCVGGALVFLLHAHGHDLSHFAIGSGGDAFEYNQLGLSVLESHTFTLGVTPEYFRTPGYPVILAALYGITHSLFGILAFQILLVALSAYLIAKMGAELDSPQIGLVAGALYALDPTVMIGTFMTLSDILFVAVLLALCYLCMKPRASLVWEACLLGFGAGFLTLIRPTGLFVLPVLLVWFVLARSRSLRSLGVPLLASLLACSAVLVPWVARNYQLTGQTAVSSVPPYNFLFYNVAEYEVAHDGGTKDSVHEHLVNEVGTSDPAELRDLRYSPRLSEVAREELRGRIGSYMVFHLEKTIPYYIGSSIQAAKRALSIQGVFPDLEVSLPNISGLILQGHMKDAIVALLADPLVLLERVVWIGILGLSISALFIARGHEQRILMFFALIALLFGVLTGPVSFPRYRLPAEPFLLLSAAYAVSMGARLWKKRQI